MTLSGWHEEPVARKHDRKDFDCADADLNDFLYRYERQSHDLGAAKTILAIDDADGKTVLGFYSLAPASLGYERAPKTLRRGLARHDVPGFRLARIATHVNVQGRGLGGQLIAAAGRRCLRAATEVGGVILIIDAKNDRAAKWYAAYGAVPLLDAPLTLVMPLASLEAELKKAGRL